MTTCKCLNRYVFLLLGSLLLVSAITAQTKDQLTIPLSKGDQPFVLHLNLQQGNIQIQLTSGKNISVEAAPEAVTKDAAKTAQNQNENQNQNVTVKSLQTEVRNVAKTVYTGKYVSATEAANHIVITPVAPKQKIDVVINVPANAGTFHLAIALKGNITIADVNGELDVTNNAGSIILKNISGSAVVTNVAGSITASFKKVPPNTPMAFSTLVGKIDVSFPAGTKANARVNSDNGELFSDVEMDFAGSTQKPAVKRTASGQYHVAIAGGLMGKMNGGGPDILFKNMEGHIYIRNNQ